MNIVDTLMNVAKGAATGAVSGPAGAITASLGGLVVDIAPEIGRWLFGAGGERTASLVAQAIETATGTSDSDAALLILTQNPEVAAKLRKPFLDIAAQQQVEGDRATEAQRTSSLAAEQGVRSQATAIVRLHSCLAWAPAVLSGIILVVFGLLIFVVLTRNVVTANSLPLANVLLGTVAAMATQVANYWLGSSSGSAAKTDQMAAMSVAAQSLVPSDVVHRLLQQPGSLATSKVTG